MIHTHKWVTIRLSLGLLQITGVLVSLFCLSYYGITALALGSVVITCLLTSVSVMIFGDRWSRERK